MAIDYLQRITKLNAYLSETKNKTIFTVAVTIFLLIALLILGILPAYSSLGAQRFDNQKRDILITELKKKLSDLKTLTADSSEVSDQIKYLDYIMPKDLPQNELVEFYNNLITQSGVNMVEITFNNRVDTNTFVVNNINVPTEIFPLGINLVVQGSRESIMRLVTNIENNSRLMDIIAFQITKKTQDDQKRTGGLGEYNSTINLFLYNWL